MQNQQEQKNEANAPTADPGFKLPGEERAPAGAVAAPAAARPAASLEVAGAPASVAADTSSRDLAIGATAFLILLLIFFFVRNAYVHHLVVRRVAPSSAGSAGWMMFVGLCFLSAAAVLALVNASKFLTFGITGPLVAVGLVALVATLFVGRR
ncbi:hypothetical protein [Massilia sp. DWR3-1-1]|uniref:hypothetical protein n=1 Tax=Massilia sp. DWR3-1-1 TaxID=2804559 RepID=UPI003CE9FDDD